MKSSDRFIVKDALCGFDGELHPIANLSVGGFFVVTPRPPVRGQLYELSLSLKEGPAFPVLGQVTWLNDPHAPKAPHLPQGFGVKIVRIEFPKKLAILDLLRRSEQVRE